MIEPQEGVTLEARTQRNGHPGAVVWLTGLPAAGKSTLSRVVESELFLRGVQVCCLDGDALRKGLCSDLAFSEVDRTENVRRVASVARLMANAGMIVLAAVVSPYRRDRLAARRASEPFPFVEVFVDCPLEICEQRDPKGLYRSARAGVLRNLTGLGAPYEAPSEPEVHVRTDLQSTTRSAAAVLEHLEGRGIVPRERRGEPGS